MFQKTIAAAVLTVLAATVAHAGSAETKPIDAYAKARAKALAQIDQKMDGTMNDMNSLFGKIFGGAFENAAGAQDTDGHGSADDTDGGCVSSADGKPGVNNNGRGSTNGGNGGTIIIDGKAAKDGCYSANGGNGGSGNFVWGNNKVGQPGKGGKIISR